LINKNIMKPQDEINELQEKINSLKHKVENCQHDFPKPVYDPETVSEGYGSVQDGKGSDPHWSFAGYHDVQKPRWSRKCNLCGKVEYTNSQKTVAIETKTEPDFGK